MNMAKYGGGELTEGIFRDWIEVTKKEAKNSIDSSAAIHHVSYSGARCIPRFSSRAQREIQHWRGAKVSTTERDLERRWIEGRGDASTARPWFNSRLENIFHGVM